MCYEAVVCEHDKMFLLMYLCHLGEKNVWIIRKEIANFMMMADFVNTVSAKGSDK